MLSRSARGLWHVVVLCASGLVCSCGGAAGGRHPCRHAAAVDEVMRRVHGGAPGRVRIGRVPRRCPHGCGSAPSAGLTKYGRRRCRQKTEQRYMCRSCGRTFSGTDGFRGRHSPAWAVAAALFAVAAGLSPARARKPAGLIRHNRTLRHHIQVGGPLLGHDGQVLGHTAYTRGSAGTRTRSASGY